MREAHPDGHCVDKKKSGGLIECFRPRRHSKLASEEELDRAAQYVVARFGAYDNEEESDEEEEGAEELEGKVCSARIEVLFDCWLWHEMRLVHHVLYDTMYSELAMA